MAELYSTLNLYATKLKEDKMQIVDNITTYLSGCTQITFNNFQYIKHATELVIKVEKPLASSFEYFKYNYAMITNSDNLGYLHFYFITGVFYESSQTIKLTLKFDYKNTFNQLGLLSFDERTYVIREHRDRFKRVAGTYDLAKIDRILEGFNLPKFNNQAITPIGYSSSDPFKRIMWYVVVAKCASIDTYLSDNIFISFVPNERIGWQDYHNTRTPTNVNCIIPSINDWALNNSGIVKIIELPYCPLPIEYVDTRSVTSDLVGQSSWTETLPYFKNKSSAISSGKWLTIENGIDADIALGVISQQIVSLGFNDEYLRSNYNLKLLNEVKIDEFYYTNNLNYTTALSSVSNTDSHNVNLETKLFHSDFYFDKFVYDSDSFIVKLEDHSPSGPNQNLDIYFFGGCYQSDGFFKFTYSGMDNNAQSDYENLLIYRRNNEVPLYSDSYTEYMRTGYNYDKKMLNNSMYQGLFSSAVSTGAGIGGLMAGRITGASSVRTLSGGVSGFSNNIFNYLNTSDNISKNIAEMKRQSANVSGVDDLMLFHHYTSDASSRLQHIHYEITDNNKQLVYNKFRLEGYATNTIKAPNVDTRRNYNYIECEPVFNSEYDSRLINYIDLIKEDFRRGVTYYHRAMFNGTFGYDFEQQYENYEKWILGRGV